MSQIFSKTALKINKSAQEVFDAIVLPEKMSQYFIGSGSAPLTPHTTVTWRWDDADVQAQIHTKEIEGPNTINFHWAAHGGEETLVEISLEALTDNQTLVEVFENGWECTPEGANMLNQQTGGWMNMLCCLKAYLEHGINLRNGAVCQ